MAIITLTSDWGDSDYYSAAVKGTIYRQIPDARIVDITHKIPVFQIAQAAYVLKNTYPDFPDGTIHIIGVNTEESMEEPHTIAFYRKQYFIGTDNGIFSLLFDEEPEKVVALDITQTTESFTFSSRDRFAQAAVHLAGGGEIEALGTVREGIRPSLTLHPIRDKERIRGVIVHVDNYQNIITNISKELLLDFVKKHRYQIQIRSGKITEISQSYGDVPAGILVAVFSAGGMLEVAMNQGDAAPLLGVKVGDAVIVELL